MLQGATASVGLLSMPGAVTRAFADDPAPLRAGEILPDPDFSLLRATTPYLVGIRPHREGGVPGILRSTLRGTAGYDSGDRNSARLMWFSARERG
jgi:hypothetical protein